MSRRLSGALPSLGQLSGPAATVAPGRMKAPLRCINTLRRNPRGAHPIPALS